MHLQCEVPSSPPNERRRESLWDVSGVWRSAGQTDSQTALLRHTFAAFLPCSLLSQESSVIIAEKIAHPLVYNCGLLKHVMLLLTAVVRRHLMNLIVCEWVGAGLVLGWNWHQCENHKTDPLRLFT